MSDSESGKTALSVAGLQYTATGGIYSYPLYTSSGVLRVPPQRGYPPHGLHPAFPLHPAAALALKDRLAGEFNSSFLLYPNFHHHPRPFLYLNVSLRFN